MLTTTPTYPENTLSQRKLHKDFRVVHSSSLEKLRPVMTDKGVIHCGAYEFPNGYDAGEKAWDHLWKAKAAAFHSPMSDWAFACLLEYLEDIYGHSILYYSVSRSLQRHNAEGRPVITVEYCCEEKDHSVIEVIDWFDFTDYFLKHEFAKSNQCRTLDKDRLSAATPDGSMFTTSYPLSKTQAKILRTILSHIEDISLENFFKALLPTYLEAKAVTTARQSVITKSDLDRTDDLEDLALIDLEEVMDLLSEPSLLRNLPTLKECMSEQFNSGVSYV